MSKTLEELRVTFEEASGQNDLNTLRVISEALTESFSYFCEQGAQAAWLELKWEVDAALRSVWKSQQPELPPFTPPSTTDLDFYLRVGEKLGMTYTGTEPLDDSQH